MTLIVGASAHGSPGVSTALQLIAAAWPSSNAVPVVVEADSTGGVLAARYELSITPGFVSLAESLRKGEAPAILDHAQRLPSGVACVALSPSATAASAQLRSAGQDLGPYLAKTGHPVLVDAGTVVPNSLVAPTLTSADLLLWFVRPTREELLVLRHRLAECPQPERVGIVLIGDRPYGAEQVSDALGFGVLHTLPIDRRAAMAANLGGDDRFLRRSSLARSCTQLATLLHGAVQAPDPVPASIADPTPERVDDDIRVWEPEEAPDVAETASSPSNPALVVWVNESNAE